MAQEELSKLSIDKGRYAAAPGGSRRRVWVWIAVAVLLLSAAAWRIALLRSVEVEVATVSLVYPSQAVSLLNSSGYVVAQRKAAVSSKATGTLAWLGVEEGSVVKKGELLARLESKDVSASRDQAAANLKVARDQLVQAQLEEKDALTNLQRYKELLSQGIVARSDYDTARLRYGRDVAATAAARAAIKAAESALKGAEAGVEYTEIRAPFDAVVLTKNADVGDIVSPLAAQANAKAAVLTLADMSSLEVEADVSEASLAKVKAGEPCEILLDALPDSRFRGELHTIVPTADRSKGSVMVKVRFIDSDKRILPEMSAKVAFLERPVEKGGGTPRIAVPPAAVASRGGKSVVFVLSGDRVAERPVTVGAKIGDLVEVSSGLKAGERIAVKPLEKLHDQSRVKVPEK
ncbi:efflux RND transporter periplasmic adaptor subunit [Geomonas sp. Red32]|uniref:efflux RND transporter periplasmic adaptor subunit n=1 Tax=Geomonas sp. Red32 TaxID=2912856 RepID=UPI00202D0310|nr:efflux RND transporter periplasmic adaptor subunit [Geomonas sp. Red32]MCM0081881.1 efflux RND transporter periplasmic adaptor subunit [Geomonas sp. Red32]